MLSLYPVEDMICQMLVLKGSRNHVPLVFIQCTKIKEVALQAWCWNQYAM